MQLFLCIYLTGSKYIMEAPIGFDKNKSYPCWDWEEGNVKGTSRGNNQPKIFKSVTLILNIPIVGI